MRTTVFVTGATGYLGGSLARALVERDHDVLGLVRDEARADALARAGCEPVLGDLDDAALLRAAARRADAVVNAADSDHRGAVEALLDALAGTGKALLHTSGSSIVADDARGEHGDAVFTEADVAPGARWRPSPRRPGASRSTAWSSTEHDAASAPRSSATRSSTVTAAAPRATAPSSLGCAISPCAPERRATSGPGATSGRTSTSTTPSTSTCSRSRAPAGAFYFVESGEADFKAMTQAIADAAGLGPARSIDIDGAIAEWGYATAVYSLGSNSRVRGERARAELGWARTRPPVLDWIADELLA